MSMEMSPLTAELVRTIEDGGWTGVAKLWKLSRPVKLEEFSDDYHPELADCEYVVTSAIVAMYSGPETYVFRADADGQVASCLKLDGSYRGDLDHQRAIDRFLAAKGGTT